MTGPLDVTVIIPTRVLAERAALLRRAIDSVLGQDGIRAVPLLVLNGTERNPGLERTLRSDRRLRILTCDGADLPAALRAGRAAVDSPWFASLDDDDLLLPGALALRTDALLRSPDHAAVVTNGIRRRAAGDVLNVPAGIDVAADPLRALFRRNWLLPGSWLCRTDAVEPSIFDGMPRYLECTYLAVRLATSVRVLWLDSPTVVYHEGMPRAESRTREFTLGQAEGLRRILALELPPDVRAGLRSQVAAACHAAADHERMTGRLRSAWRWHMASLAEAGGWRYLAFTRHLLRDGLRAFPPPRRARAGTREGA